MSTRSFIGTYNDDNTLTGIYCHFDGYPEYVGRTLLEHWTDPDKVNALMALGNLSMLGMEVGEAHGFDDTDHPKRHEWCLAYGRDRGETGQEAQTFADHYEFLKAANESCAEYAYLLDEDYTGVFTWRVYDLRGSDIRDVLGLATFSN